MISKTSTGPRPKTSGAGMEQKLHEDTKTTRRKVKCRQ